MKKLHVEKVAAEAVIQNRKAYVSQVNEFAEELKIENIQLTNEILSEFQSRGTEYIAELLVAGAVGEFNKIGLVATSVVQANLNDHAYEIANRYDKFFVPLRENGQAAGIGPGHVVIQDGKAIFTEVERKQIVEDHTVYLKEEDKELHDQLTQFAQVLNEMASYLEKKTNLSLLDCLQVITSQSSFVIDSNMKRQIKDDTYFIVNEKGAFEMNPAFF